MRYCLLVISACAVWLLAAPGCDSDGDGDCDNTACNNACVASGHAAGACSGGECVCMGGDGDADSDTDGDGDGDGDADSDADSDQDGDGPVGTGESVTEVIGPEGGSMTLEGVTLTFPAGAVAEEQEITITSTTEAAPDGYDAYSPVYRFEPDGMTFDHPLNLSIDFEGQANIAAMFWSRTDTTGFERLGGTVSGSAVNVEVSHFSRGFVADGVDYSDPPDLSCVESYTIEGRTTDPSAVAMFFTVDDCWGRPVTGLDESNFEVRENDTVLSVESALTILPRDGLQVFVSLVLDMSSSTSALLPSVIEGARAFVNRLQVIEGLPVQISIQLFSGEPTLTEWQAPTLDPDTLLARLDELSSYTSSDPSSTNLNGALIEALNRQAAAERAFRDRNFGGAFTTGYVVLFTDGRDTSGLHTSDEAVAARDASVDQVLAVGLESSADYDRAALEVLAPRAVVTAPDTESLDREFQDVAHRIAGQVSRTYLLGYCSPRRSGEFTVTVGVRDTTNDELATWDFRADGFGPGCTAATFENACPPEQECGGLGCGACDDRVAVCDSTYNQCVSYCFLENWCGGNVFVNPLGYSQVCEDTETWVSDCSATRCTDISQDPNHCGGCDVQCESPTDESPGESCIGGLCVLSGEPSQSDAWGRAGSVVCGDDWACSSYHCVLCGTGNEVCEAGSVEFCWSRYMVRCDEPEDCDPGYACVVDTDAWYFNSWGYSSADINAYTKCVLEADAVGMPRACAHNTDCEQGEQCVLGVGGREPRECSLLP